MTVKKYVGILSAAVYIIAASCNTEPKNLDVQQKNSNPKLDKIKLQPGFKAEHLYSPYDNKTGSWVSLAFDNKGRLIASDQYGALYRMNVPVIGVDSPAGKIKIEKIEFDIRKAEGGDSGQGKLQMGYAQGLVWAYNSLFVIVNHKGDSNLRRTSGFYRLQDTNNDDKFDKISLLTTLIGEEEHGPHSIKLSPDGKSFYIIAGNNTKLPPKINNYTIPPIWKRDNILADRFEQDLRNTSVNGWIAKVDTSGKNWELVSAGLRNPFDLAFNEAGDLFTYDSDMEWDIGMPWYRPTRICHVTSGSEFGFRDGNGKWSPSYLDNLPPIINIGQGSPTNLISLKDARFPPIFKNTILASDWSFGIMYAIHLTSDGASYKVKAEEFLSGAPLPLTDGVVGPDGALYFLTGGRRLESDLYRVYYKDGKNDLVADPEKVPEMNEATKLRRQLEQFHGKPDPQALGISWPNLKNKDRFIRYAARMAIEHQPVAQWQEKVLTEKDPVILINGLVALAHLGNKSLKTRIFDILMKLDYSILSESLQLDYLRTVELTLSRMGQPNPGQNEKLIAYLSPKYPAATNDLNRALSKVLVFIEDPTVVQKTLSMIDSARDDSTGQETLSKSSDLILRNPQYGMDIANILTSIPPAQQIYYAIVISEIKKGWTPELREKYFKWYYKAYGFRGGRHYVGHLDKAKESALKNVPKELYKHYDTMSTNTKQVREVIDWVKIMSNGGPGRQWNLEAAADSVKELSGRNFKQAKNMFTAAACINCHAVGGEGGAIGPDLTQLGTRFSTRDILESIIDPSKTISDQYASTVFSLKDGNSVMGKLVRDDKKSFFISQNPFSPQTLRELRKKEVSATRTADVSLMPPQLINQLNPERLRDLMAYLISGGNENHPVFEKKINKLNK